MVACLRELALVNHVPDARALEELVAADVVDVEVRVHDGRDVAEAEAALRELRRDRLFLGLLR